MGFELQMLRAAPHRPTTVEAPASRSREARLGTAGAMDFRSLLRQTVGAPSPPPAAPSVLAPKSITSGGGIGTSPPVTTAAAAGPTLAPGITSAILSLPNGGLMTNPTGNNALTGGTIAYNPNYYATPQAAAMLAQQLGGTVVDLGGQFSNNQPEYYIRLPNGTTINAGNLVAICNNPVLNTNAGIMDHMIAELLNNNAPGTTGVGSGLYTVHNGQIRFDPNGQAVAPTLIRT